MDNEVQQFSINLSCPVMILLMDTPHISLIISLCCLPLPPFLLLAFTLFQLIAVGAASFFAAALLSALVYSNCHHMNRPSAESAVIHPSTPNHLTYNKQGNSTPKNEKYIPMEFKVGCFSYLLLCKFLVQSIHALIFTYYTLDNVTFIREFKWRKTSKNRGRDKHNNVTKN